MKIPKTARDRKKLWNALKKAGVLTAGALAAGGAAYLAKQAWNHGQHLFNTQVEDGNAFRPARRTRRHPVHRPKLRAPRRRPTVVQPGLTPYQQGVIENAFHGTAQAIHHVGLGVQDTQAVVGQVATVAGHELANQGQAITTLNQGLQHAANVVGHQLANQNQTLHQIVNAGGQLHHDVQQTQAAVDYVHQGVHHVKAETEKHLLEAANVIHTNNYESARRDVVLANHVTTLQNEIAALKNQLSQAFHTQAGAPHMSGVMTHVPTPEGVGTQLMLENGMLLEGTPDPHGPGAVVPIPPAPLVPHSKRKRPNTPPNPPPNPSGVVVHPNPWRH